MSDPGYKVRCNCEHEFQDKTYGKGVRVATPANNSKIDGKITQVSCTVCNQAHRKFSTSNKM